MTEPGREGLTEAVLNRYNADKPSACSGVPAPQGDLDSKASKSVRNRTISSLVEQSFSALSE